MTPVLHLKSGRKYFLIAVNYSLLEGSITVPYLWLISSTEKPWYNFKDYHVRTNNLGHLNLYNYTSRLDLFPEGTSRYLYCPPNEKAWTLDSKGGITYVSLTAFGYAYCTLRFMGQAVAQMGFDSRSWDSPQTFFPNNVVDWSAIDPFNEYLLK